MVSEQQAAMATISKVNRCLCIANPLLEGSPCGGQKRLKHSSHTLVDRLEPCPPAVPQDRRRVSPAANSTAYIEINSAGLADFSGDSGISDSIRWLSFPLNCPSLAGFDR